MGSHPSNHKRVAFYTFGCRLNQYDTEAMRTLLEGAGGYRPVNHGEAADLYVVNTCSVTARADATARKAIRRIHASRPDARIVVTGCYAQRAPQEIAALPGVSLIVGAADRERIAHELELAPGDGARVAVSPIAEAKRFLEIPITEMLERSRAVVKVQEGCNHACTFCIVPATRGVSRSRDRARVLEQVRRLVAGGYREVVLTGVHIGDYGLDLPAGGPALPELVEEILDVPGLARLRLSSIEPASVGRRLVALMSRHEKFARHFHIPLQSGSDEILERMGRGYRAGDFARLTRTIATEIPGCGIGTDVICGFPGETDDHFQRTFELLQSLPISYVHAFTYSVRPGSAAEALGDRVPGEVKKRRTRALKRLSEEKQRGFRLAHVGRIVSVLVEAGRGPDDPGRGGLTDNYLKVALAADARPGLVDVRITGLRGEGLVGEPLAPTSPSRGRSDRSCSRATAAGRSGPSPGNATARGR